MNIYLYSQFVKRINSTKQPTGSYTTKDVKLKENTSFLNPSFLLTSFDPSYNYVYVPSWGRYYFVTDFTLRNNNVYEISCTIDVLASYKASIGALTTMVERSSSSFNTYFNDELVSSTQQLVSMDRAIITTTDYFSRTHGTYILRIAGGDSDGISTFVTNDLSKFGPIFDKENYFDPSTAEEWLQAVGNYVFDPYEYVVGLYWTPLKLSVFSNNGAIRSPVYVKWYYTGINDANVLKIPNSTSIYLNLYFDSVPTNIYSDFRKYNPEFSKYKVNVPGVGYIDIDANHVSTNLTINYNISLEDGMGVASLEDNPGVPKHIAKYPVSLYKSMQYGSDSQNASQVLSGALTTMGAVKSGNIPMGITGAVSTIKNIIVPTPSIGGSNSPTTWLDTEASIELFNYGSGGIDVTNWGRPLHQVVQIGTLSGFVKCSSTSIDNIAGTTVEKDEINRHLTQGFYYE